MAGAGRLWPLEFPALPLSLALDPGRQRLPSSAPAALPSPRSRLNHTWPGEGSLPEPTLSLPARPAVLRPQLSGSACPSLASGPCFPAGHRPPAPRALLSAHRTPPPFAAPTLLSAPSFPSLPPSHLDRPVHPETPDPGKPSTRQAWHPNANGHRQAILCLQGVSKAGTLDSERLYQL